MEVVLKIDSCVVLLRVVLRYLLRADDLTEVADMLDHVDHAEFLELSVDVLALRL